MGIKVMVIREGELAKGNNGKGDCENGEEERIVGKGQHVVLKGKLPGEGELDFFCFSHFPFRYKYKIISHN